MFHPHSMRPRCAASKAAVRCRGIVEKPVEHYAESIHGRGALQGGLTVAANCAKCRSGSNRRFAGYLTHANHHDPDKYPFLFYTIWGMTSQLIETFPISGIHTLMWLPRSLEYRRQLQLAEAPAGAPCVPRFEPFRRNLHLMVIFSFLGLALSGMILKFSCAGLAKAQARLMGGFEGDGPFHRCCALLKFHLLRAVLGRNGDRRHRSAAVVPGIVHAAGFILAVHCFYTHFRPEKFPVDTVISDGGRAAQGVKARPAPRVPGVGGSG